MECESSWEGRRRQKGKSRREAGTRGKRGRRWRESEPGGAAANFSSAPPGFLGKVSRRLYIVRADARPLLSAIRELQRSDPRGPVEPYVGIVVLVGVPERAGVRAIEGHARVVAPAIVRVRLKARALFDQSLGVRCAWGIACRLASEIDRGKVPNGIAAEPIQRNSPSSGVWPD
jgi:hypothetical protein